MSITKTCFISSFGHFNKLTEVTVSGIYVHSSLARTKIMEASLGNACSLAKNARHRVLADQLGITALYDLDAYPLHSSFLILAANDETD